MKPIYARQALPDSWRSSIFLAGPTPRSAAVASWRPQALALLQQRGFTGVVFVPEDHGGVFRGSYLDQVEWERAALSASDVILFWVPRDLKTLPGFTTNVEFGTWVTSGRCVLGFPEDAPKCRYLGWLADREHVPRRATLADTIDAALKRLAAPAMRTDGEREVPLRIWNTPAFQRWYTAQKAAGNTLRGAQALWQFQPSRATFPFAWIMRVQVWVAAEARLKHNEWVFAREDISAVVMHGPIASDWRQTEVVLAREFRSPVRNRDGFVRELPGGSSYDASKTAADVALEEVEEEAGLTLTPERLIPIQDRQVAGTLSSHHAHLFRVALTTAELLTVKEMIADERTLGTGDSERIHLEVWTPAEMVADERLDWVTIGMVTCALSGER